jgi:bifunctional non-homologous end joining protein LigD
MTLPRVQPIIPIPRKEPFDDPEWLFDFKYDGFRALLYFEQGMRCRFVSRNDNTLSRFDALCQAVAAELDVDSVILDGEVIATDETGRPLFFDLVRGSRTPAYVAFDLLWLNGTDLLSLPLSERRRRMQSLLPKHSSVISEALSVQGRGHELFELMRSHAFPASQRAPAAHADDRYDPRVRWYKIKNPDYSQKEGREDLFNRPRSGK